MHWTLVKRLVPRGLKQSVKRDILQTVENATNEASYHGALNALRASFNDLQVQVRQLELTLQHEQNVPPVPPKHLQARVTGRYWAEFVSSGYDTLQQVDGLLRQHGKRLQDFSRILDFGCGCGRVIRALRATLPDGELHGADIDAEAIGWLQKNCSSIAKFHANPHAPPTVYSDNTFDLIYSISIFSHLPEDLQFAWLEELQRIASPGGYLVLTTHRENHHNLPPAGRDVVQRTGFYFMPVGKTDGLPDFYQAAFQSEDYIRRQWGRYFEVVHIANKGFDGHQEMIVLRKHTD